MFASCLSFGVSAFSATDILHMCLYKIYVYMFTHVYVSCEEGFSLR